MPTFDRTEEVIGYAKKLSYCDTENGTYIQIGGTTDIQLPERELGKAEITNDDSPDFHKDYIPGLYEPGNVTFKYKYGKTVYGQVETVFQLATVAATRASATKYWKVALPEGSVAKFRGFLTKNSLPLAMEDAIECEGEIQVIGKMTFTPYVAP